MTDTIKLAPRPLDNPYVAANKDQWRALETLKLSTFKYEVDGRRGVQKLANELHRGDWKDIWEGTAAPISHTQALTSTFGTYLDHPGRFTPRLYLAESYDVPSPGVFAGSQAERHQRAKKRQEKDHAVQLGQGHAFDVFSEGRKGMTGFRALARRGDGYALAWGGGGLDFPTLYDADNDGLPATSDGDDSRADRDGDGLLD